MNNQIEVSIKKSQRCQRNWNLEKTIPEADLKTIVIAATECPSKQNICFYNVHVIQNREIIEDIHDVTFFENDYGEGSGTTNPQVLANLLLAFTKNDLRTDANQETYNKMHGKDTEANQATLDKDLHQSIGVAAGMVNLTASLLGYQTGCCACFDGEKIKSILKTDDEPIVLMGVGIKDETLNRRQHHITHDMIPSFNKNISVNYI